MTTFRTITLGLLLSLLGAPAAFAQADAAAKRPAPDGATVTISISAKGVRFSSPGSVGQVRLEVFDAGGASVYNSEFQPGNVRDWALVDKQGQALADGSYLCVVTVRGLSKRMSVKQGTVVIEGGRASLQLVEGDAVGSVESEKSLAQVTTGGATAGTILAHDGKVGQVVSTSGGLAFRAGDFFGGKDRELMRLTPEGNLGVGVASPQAKLDVAGAIRARGGILFEDGTVLKSAGGVAAGRGGAAALGAAAGGGVTTAAAGAGTSGRIAKWTDNAGTLGDSTITETPGGFVGIGTTTPDSTLSVQGAIPTFAGHLQVVRTTGSNNGYGLLLDSVGAGNNNLGLSVGGDPKGAFGWDVPRSFMGFVNFIFSRQDFALRLNVDGSLSFNDGSIYPGPERFRVTAAGDVGIGTSSPQARLDVVGDLRVTGNAVVNGNIAAKYQDVAEWVPARQKIAAGTVVILDTTRTNGVAPSRRRYDTHVAGVVSAQPGVILGQGGEGQVLVATTGRVKVMVDATQHPIRIGDLLVTSDTPGLAMKSQPVRVGGNRLHRPGTIIGKALEPLSGGKGEILVLLSLQ
jgi:hypothetical protein